MSSTEQVSVTRTIDAPASDIFALLSDPARHQDFDGSGTVQGARSGSKQLALGDVFGMSMRMGLPYATRNKVVELEKDRRIAWQVQMPFPLSLMVGGRVWRYELEPAGSKTKVTETWDTSEEALPSRAVIRARMSAMTKRNMERTLARIEELVTGDR